MLGGFPENVWICAVFENKPAVVIFLKTAVIGVSKAFLAK
jgi:hypothetical protein